MITLSTCILLAHLAFVVSVIAPARNIEGDPDGVNGNGYYTGSPNVPKIILGNHCKRDNDSTDEVSIILYAHQDDTIFGYSADSPVNPGELIQYELCYALNYTQFRNGDAVAADDCGYLPSATFTRVANNGLEEDFGQRTQYLAFTANFSLAVPDGEGPCGGIYETGTYYLAVYCKMDPDFDKDFDIAFSIEFEHNSSLCLVETLDSLPNTVGPVPVVKANRTYGVSLDVYEADAIDEYITGPDAVTAGKWPVNTVDLGTLLFLEVCLTGPEFFYANDFSPVGCKVTSCTAYPVAVDTDHVNMGDSRDFIDENGCALGVDPVQLENGTYGFKYVQNDTVDSTNPYLRSPNCFRTAIFPGVSFARVGVFDTVAVKYTCHLDYCTDFENSTGESCFGKDISGTSDYSGSCDGESKVRRKREVQFDEDIFPPTISTTVYFKQTTNANTEAPAKRVQSGCFEKTTFIGLSSALGVLLLVVLIIASYFALRLWSSTDENFSRTTDSMTGIKNKAYF